MANILVVDDDKVLLKIIEAALIQAGHSVLTVEDGRTAIEKLEAELFDLIITDINMPGGVSGFNLINIIRKNEKLKELPAVILSGRRDKADIVKALEAGIDDYVIKPFKTDMLYGKIASLLEKKSGQGAADCPVKVKANFPVELDITNVSEQGVTLVSSIPFQINFKLKLECELFSEIGLSNPLMRIAHSSSASGTSKLYTFKANFVGLSVKEQQKLRDWVQLKSKRTKKAS